VNWTENVSQKQSRLLSSSFQNLLELQEPFLNPLGWGNLEGSFVRRLKPHNLFLKPLNAALGIGKRST